MKDITGKEIKHGDTLEVKFLYGADVQPFTSHYKVYLNPFKGVELRIIDNKEENPMTYLSWESGHLREDYANGNFDRLAVREKWFQKNTRDSFIETYYSNKIRIVSEKKEEE